jgi:kinesin family protein 2/24
MELFKQERAAEEQRNRDNGTPGNNLIYYLNNNNNNNNPTIYFIGDVDFQRMVKQYRTDQCPLEKDHIATSIKICICVRKRPISNKEIARKDFDSVTCINPYVVVHDCKFRVDGISKYLDNTSFEVDHSFHENNTTEEVYQYAVQPLVEFVINGGRATVFAYGQTGSGKTYTMVGIQSQMADELFRILESSTMHSYTQVFVSFFEIYGGRCQDLLNNRQRLNVREDGGGEVVVSDLMEAEANTAEMLQRIIDSGNKNRTTHATESNDVSSRSHAICQIRLVNSTTEKEVGRFSLIDLAGSERGADTKSHNRQRRMEGAEINKSLLALKECIRALDGNTTHVPYRGSKLTLVLKDSFTRQNSRTVMIANVSPAASSADHTLNTLRYADRIKDRGQGQAKRDRDMPTPPPPSLSGIPYSAPRSAPKKETPITSANKVNVKNVSNDKDKGARRLEQDLEEDLAAEIELDEDADDEFHKTVEDLFEEEEALLNLHMNIIQENAELLTEEGRLLQQIQSDDGDIDAYAARLENILDRKQELITILRGRLSAFRKQLMKEEMISTQRIKKSPGVF